MDRQKGLTGFIVVLSGEIIEIPQDSDKSWLTLFYSLPRELAEKWKSAYELPRCPYEVLRTDKYDHIVCDDMFKLLVWDCYAWSAWQFFQVKDSKGNYRDIPGSWTQYAGYFPLWRLPYSIIPYIRMKFEQNGLGFQELYNIPQGVEKFGMLTGGKFLYKLSVPLSNDCTTFEDGKPIYVSMASPYALRELVKAIYIEAPDKSSGKRRQNIRISYDLVGFIPVEELVKEETA